MGPTTHSGSAWAQQPKKAREHKDVVVFVTSVAYDGDLKRHGPKPTPVPGGGARRGQYLPQPRHLDLYVLGSSRRCPRAR